MIYNKMGSEPAQQKFAEKLIILNDRSLGMLIRFYNMKKACADPKSRPQFLSDKSLDPAIAQIIKRFPVIDIKRNSAAFACVNEMKGDILKKLSLYYYTFADLLDLRDAILQLFTAMDANQCKLELVLNFDLTTGFLNLLVNYISLMILLSRLDDRRAVLGLYNAAYDLAHANSEPSFPRLGQMVVDYELPMKKLAEDLGLSYRLISFALDSLREIYFKRNISAEQQREAAMISLTAHPKQILYAALTNTIACEYLSLDTMDRWIIFGLTFCHRLLTDPNHSANLLPLFQRSIQHGMTLRLFRDESILIYPMIQAVLEPNKGHAKMLSELKDLSNHTLQSCGHLHAHRRQFLRMALRELYLLITDQPGLLGPKALFVWMGLSFARDEVLWLLRHIDIWPQLLQSASISKKALAKSGLANILTDKFLPELFFYMCELRNLVMKHAEIIANYHIDYVSGYDAPLLAEQFQQFDGSVEMSDYESLLIHACVDSLSNVKTECIDSRAIRLDWFRFQASSSLGRSSFKLQNYANFAISMNTALFHLKQIDDLEEMLKETSDLSIYCFYPHLFDSHLCHSLNFPVQSRFSVSFAHIAAHFTNSLHEMCPEEKEHIVERGLVYCKNVLDELAKKTIDVFTQLSDDEIQMAQCTSPQACARIIALACQPATKGQQPQHQSATDEKMPGYESMRTAGQPVSSSDSNALYLAELCQAIGSSKELHISRHIFVPREFLAQYLERHLNSSLVHHLRSCDAEHPRRPSEMLAFLNSKLNALQNLDTFLSFDIVRLFTDAMLQQSQKEDANGQETLAEIYSKWYLDVLLRRASVGQLLYSEHLQAFVTSTDTPFLNSDVLASERYTDPRELRSLAQLIGPYGIKAMEERLVWHIASQITELFKLVRGNREALHAARVSYDKPAKLREIVTQLDSVSESPSNSSKESRRSFPHPSASSSSPIESLLQRVIIIGEIIAFRDLLFAALKDVLRERTPFLIRSLASLVDFSLDELQKVNIGEACAASGFKLDVDLALANAIKQQASSNGLNDTEEHYNIACLLIVFIAIALPKLALSSHSFFHASLMVAKNSSHTIPLAVNTLAGALFFLHQRADTGDRMREFLALASSGLLQIMRTSDQMQGQSVYLLLDRLAHDSACLNYGLLETCFPYSLVRSAFLNCYQRDGSASDDNNQIYFPNKTKTE